MTEEKIKRFINEILDMIAEVKAKRSAEGHTDNVIGSYFALGDWDAEKGIVLTPPMEIGDVPKVVAEIMIQAVSIRYPSDVAIVVTEAWERKLTREEYERRKEGDPSLAGPVRDMAGRRDIVMLAMKDRLGGYYMGRREVNGEGLVVGETVWTGFGEGRGGAEQWDRFLDRVVFRKGEGTA